MYLKLEHIGIMVQDMDRSVQFYTEILGLKLVSREKLANGNELGFLAYPGSDNIQLELIKNWHEGLPARGNVDHVAFTVTDIDAEAARLKSLGVKLIDEAPRDLAIGEGVRIFFFYGPDGERLELFQYNK